MQKKFFAGKFVADRTLGARQVLVIASDDTADRCDDVMVPQGCDLSNYRHNPIVLANHDPNCPIGNAEVTIRNRVEALIDFAPEGASALADEYCALCKAGVLRAVSVGFRPLRSEPMKTGGYRYLAWELLELSICSVPANPGALIIGRSHGKAGRVLSEMNASKLRDAHDAAEKCRGHIADVLEAGGDRAGGDEEDDDGELSYRRRQVALLELSLPPSLSGNDDDRARRKRDMELLRLKVSPR